MSWTGRVERIVGDVRYIADLAAGVGWQAERLGGGWTEGWLVDVVDVARATGDVAMVVAVTRAMLPAMPEHTRVWRRALSDLQHLDGEPPPEPAPPVAPTAGRPMLTSGQVAERLQVSTQTLATMRRRATGPPCTRVGGRWRYDAYLLDEWIGSRT